MTTVDDILSILSTNIQYYMSVNDLNQEELAEKIGSSSSSISMYVHKQRLPRIETLIKMANVFGVTVSDLFDPEIFDRKEV